MAGEFHGSNHSISPAHHNPTPYESAFTGSSSSSFLTTQFKSELNSTEADNDDEDEDEFITELTRKMQDYLLQEDDDDSVSQNLIPKVKSPNQNQNQHRVVVNSKRGRRWKMSESTQQMRAVFLNRPGSKTGTGVFLPPTAQSRKIPSGPGCSAALVPTRVLEALQQHFNNLGSLSPLNRLLHTAPTHQGQRRGMQQKSWWRSTSIDHVKKKLPQEWTY